MAAKSKSKSFNKIQWLEDIRIAGAKLRNNVWKERYLSIVNTPKRLQYWQQKEKNFLNRLVVVNNEQLAKIDNPSVKKARSWLKEIWPFGEHCERIYKLPADLDAIYLAVGLRLDILYRARVFVTEEMVKIIVGEWQFAVKSKISELNVFLCFGPCFEGDYMADDDPLETFWGYIEADLKAKGFLKTVVPTKKHKTKAKRKSSQYKNAHKKPPMSKPLSSAKWAIIFGVSPSTMYRWREEKKYPFEKISERKWALPIDRIPDEYLQNYRQTKLNTS